MTTFLGSARDIAASLGRRRGPRTRPFGSSVRRITHFAPALYAKAVIYLEIGLIAAIVVFFIVADLYVRGCEKI
jgi:hypothetical protein